MHPIKQQAMQSLTLSTHLQSACAEAVYLLSHRGFTAESQGLHTTLLRVSLKK